jgi:hypothetical protein
MTISSTLAILLGGGNEVLAQPTQCMGFPTPIKTLPYDLLITSRVETRGNERVVVACVQNNTHGYVRWRWLIPGIDGDFEGPGVHEKEWPVPTDIGLNFAEGCYIYGNLNTTGKAFFYADSAQIVEADGEKKNGCPTR